MRRETRRRPQRPDPAPGGRRGPGLEVLTLETRMLLSSSSSPSGIPFYVPTDLPPRTVDHSSAVAIGVHPESASPRQLSFLDNDGKVLTGKDRQGDEWTITVHGPGVVIVTDASPNDGMLDDDINTIQLVGTNLNSTYVTGQVVQSARLQTDGQIFFNHLVAPNGVASIVLNGFTLVQSIAPPTGLDSSSDPAVFLPGGVKDLEFHDIQSQTNLANGPIQPIDIIIGQPNQPLTVAPSIRLESIFNTVFDTSGTISPTTPRINPSVRIIVNGQLQSLNIVSSTAAPVPAADQFAFPTVATTGRTSVRALGVGNLNVTGSATNFTVSRRAVPFESGFSGVNHIGSATFGGTADAVGLDVNGPIGRLTFLRGLGNPTGSNGTANTLGVPVASFGYPAAGLLGGLVTAKHIGKLTLGPANQVLQTANDPDFVQLYRQGTTVFYPRPGEAMTHAAIVSSGSLDNATIVGNLLNSEIKTGFHYPSFVAGLEGTRAPSQIGKVTQRGDLIDSVISATWRPFLNAYGVPGNLAGPGRITGHMSGQPAATGTGVTPLNNTGAGYFAAFKKGYLPPPQHPARINNVLVPTL